MKSCTEELGLHLLRKPGSLLEYSPSATSMACRTGPHTALCSPSSGVVLVCHFYVTDHPRDSASPETTAVQLRHSVRGSAAYRWLQAAVWLGRWQEGTGGCAHKLTPWVEFLPLGRSLKGERATHPRWKITQAKASLVQPDHTGDIPLLLPPSLCEKWVTRSSPRSWEECSRGANTQQAEVTLRISPPSFVHLLEPRHGIRLTVL